MAFEPKAEGAFLTIGELADELGLPHHVLRYWETRFPQLKPLQRAGNRRYYRAEDAALAREINRLLYQEGYSVRGVQKLLDGAMPLNPVAPAPLDLPASAAALPHHAFATAETMPLSALELRDDPRADQLITQIKAVRTRLGDALARFDAAR